MQNVVNKKNRRRRTAVKSIAKNSVIESRYNELEANLLVEGRKVDGPATNQYEFDRDLAIFMCRDLVPFEADEKHVFRSFC